MTRWLAFFLLLVTSGTCAQAQETPLVAIIIDDLGDQAESGARVAELPGPLACAVMPWTPHARELAEACHGSGKEVVLHLPMQAVSGRNPGVGALTLDMLPDEFSRHVGAALAAIPHVMGVNNHMGSLLTQAPAPMSWLMQAMRETHPDLIFIDSRTSPRTVARRMAAEHGVVSLRRDVFLDNVRDEAAILRQIELLVDRARRRGAAIGIGHPYPETIAVLERLLPRLERDYRVRLVALRDMAERP